MSDKLTKRPAPSFRPNHQISAPYQYGRPFGLRDAAGLLLVTLMAFAAAVLTIQWIPR
jgi:hypothetical protein